MNDLTKKNVGSKSFQMLLFFFQFLTHCKPGFLLSLLHGKLINHCKAHGGTKTKIE